MFDGERLTMTSTNEECPGRKLVLTTHPWDLAIPTGAYAATIAVEDVPDDFQDVVGDWVITFLGDYYAVQLNSHIAVVGRYAISGNEVTFTDLDGPFSCAPFGPHYVDGTYEWRYLRGMLTVTLITDRCDGRATVIPLGPFTKLE
jgi:hypothetical protein